MGSTRDGVRSESFSITHSMGGSWPLRSAVTPRSRLVSRSPSLRRERSVECGGFRQQYDVSRDGQRFMLNVPTEDTPSLPITVVLNWTAGLKK